MEIDSDYIKGKREKVMTLDDGKCVSVKGVSDIGEKVSIEQYLKQLLDYSIKATNLLIELNKSSTIYERYYYDVSTSIDTAVTSAPESAESTSYTRHSMHERIDRNAKKLSIYNDGPGTLYVVIYHKENNPSSEFPLYEGEAKTYMNVFEVKVRAPVAGLNYRVTEYELWKQKNIEYFTGNPYISETFIANVGLANANIEDIRDGASTINGVARDDTAQCLRRNAHSGELANLGLGNLFVAFNDGTGYSNERTIPPNNSQDLAGMDIARLRIRTDIINTQYRLAAQ